ncbi:hypothetical protein L596_004478 [Steinernema carpocapsae]|uniref:Uncharacterized protein n=1 Tax=Steinernema carpocapsae TaxID=34508 RepID=A0A4U8UXG2_STECR|nr:hypothetical protein L596_004478 [Steinernema carpocapsae]
MSDRSQNHLSLCLFCKTKVVSRAQVMLTAGRSAGGGQPQVSGPAALPPSVFIPQSGQFLRLLNVFI